MPPTSLIATSYSLPYSLPHTWRGSSLGLASWTMRRGRSSISTSRFWRKRRRPLTTKRRSKSWSKSLKLSFHPERHNFGVRRSAFGVRRSAIACAEVRVTAFYGALVRSALDPSASVAPNITAPFVSGQARLHPRIWDANARREIAAGDIAIFANGWNNDPGACYSFTISAVL